MNTWIVNASPLILLGKINRLNLLVSLPPSLRIPKAVSLEILAGPDSDPAKIWIQNARNASLVVPNSAVSPQILAWDLGAGETSVISLALEYKDSICILDDLAARNCAKVFRIPVIGTLGILIKAKFSGLIPALRPELDRLVEVGSMLSGQVIQEALNLAGESS